MFKKAENKDGSGFRTKNVQFFQWFLHCKQMFELSFKLKRPSLPENSRFTDMKKMYYLGTCSTCAAIIKETGITNKEFEMQDIKTEKITSTAIG